MKFAVTQAICIGAVLLGVTGVTAMGISMVNTLQAQAADEVQADGSRGVHPREE